MNKKNLKIIIFSLFLFIFVLANNFALADDDNEEDEREGGREEENYQSPQEIQAETPVAPLISPIPTPVPLAPVTRIVTVSTPLVNLSDADSDGIIDILDSHNGEDDFAFAILDNNKNGIADDLEYLSSLNSLSRER